MQKTLHISLWRYPNATLVSKNTSAGHPRRVHLVFLDSATSPLYPYFFVSYSCLDIWLHFRCKVSLKYSLAWGVNTQAIPKKPNLFINVLICFFIFTPMMIDKEANTDRGGIVPSCTKDEKYHLYEFSTFIALDK